MTNVDTSLKKIASIVAEKLRKRVSCSIPDAVNAVLESFDNKKSDVTLKRRVYDVINVLEATGVIRKTQNIITWTGNVHIPNGNDYTSSRTQLDSEHINRRIGDKIEKLRYKLNILKHYNAIIRRNKLLPRPARSLSIQTFACIAKSYQEFKTPNGLTVILPINPKPQLITPLQILESIGFRFDIDQLLLEDYPQLKRALQYINDADDIE